MLCKLHLCNNIIIFKDENPHLDVHTLREQNTHQNPLYFKNINMGFSTFGISPTIPLLAEHQDYVELPRGLVSALLQQYPDVTIIDETATQQVDFTPSKIILKPHQQEALNKLMEKNQGIFAAPPGTGKTVVGIELILRKHQRSLVLVHTKDLLQQWGDRIEQFTGITPGRINTDRCDIKPVTIGMVQALNRPIEKGILDGFGLILLDEAHHCPAYTFRNLLCQFPARYRYGLTATPDRQDGLTFLMHAVLGGTIYEVKEDGLFLNGDILKPAVKAIHTRFYLPNVTGYAELIEEVTHSDDRNNLIIQTIKAESEMGHYCLVLSERVAHAVRLHKMFMERSSVKAVCVTGTHSEQHRSESIEALNNGSVRVLFSTRIADEGLDIKRLDPLILTCPIRATNKLNQQIGRIMRVFPGKKDCIVFDFVDSLTSLANSQYFTRKEKVYKQYDFEEILYEALHGY